LEFFCFFFSALNAFMHTFQIGRPQFFFSLVLQFVKIEFVQTKKSRNNFVSPSLSSYKKRQPSTMIGVTLLALFVALAFGETEQTGPSVVGLYGGIVAQPKPAVYYNATVTMTPAGTGTAAFWNPALGFACLGALKFFSGTSYTYNLQLDRSTIPNACVLYGSVVLTAGPGYSVFSLYPQSSTTPAFTATLTQWV
jgi:hypothetical protein